MKQRESVQRIDWLNISNLSNYDDRRLPVVAHGFPDINQDGAREVLIASHKRPVLFAFDGKSGQSLWHYVASPTLDQGERPYPHFYAAALNAPTDIGDVDGDEVRDFATTFFSKGKRVYRWLDAVSGKTGKHIWRLEMAEDWFDKGQHNVSDFCQYDVDNANVFRHMHSTGNYRDGMAFRNRPAGFVVPWPSVLMPAERESETDSLLLVCGTKLMVRDAKTGKATDFNQGEPLELGFIPALPPKIVRSGIESEAPIGVLLCEPVAIADPNTTTKPVTRFSMWSLETAKKIWHYDAANDPGWIGTKPDWPLVADLTGDRVPEILIADGADLENNYYSGATCLASLQALDARTGKPVWNKNDVAKIRNQDRQVQHVLVGPDADDDQRDDVYAVSTMSIQGKGNWVFVDILSSVTGKLIRTTKSDAPVFATAQNGIDLEQPFCLGVGADGHARLVVATKNVDGHSSRQGTLILSTGTGEVTHVGDQLEHPLRADGDGDGNLDLFLIRPRSSGSLSEAGQLVSLKANAGHAQKLIGGRFVPTDDVDGDGVRDLVTDPRGNGIWQSLSGATGERLWRWEYQPQGSRIAPLNKDVDGDNINDFLVTRKAFGGQGHRLWLTLVSGCEGRMLWQKDLPTDSWGGRVGIKCDDMNADGVNDVVLLHRFSALQTGLAKGDLRLSCFDGRFGTEHWHCELAAAGSKVLEPSFELDDYPLSIADTDNDGSPDVVCRRFAIDGSSKLATFNGRSGEPLWQRSVADDNADVMKGHRFSMWRAKVLATGPDQQQQLVTAAAHKNNQKADWTVRLKFYDLQSGQSVSSWSGEGQFKRYPQHSANPPGLWNGIPFEIAAGEKRYTGVCVQDSKARKLQIVVLDSSQAAATEVQRVDVPEPENVGAGYAWTGQFLIADANQDGRTDVIFHDGSNLIATDLVSNKEVIRKPMPASYRRLLEVNPETSLIQMIVSNDQDPRLKLIDLATFDTVWNLHRPTGGLIDGLLSGGKPDESNVYAALPRVLYQGTAENPQTLRTVATVGEYTGKDTAIKQQIASAAAEPINFAANSFYDPRMIEPLPWAGGNLPGNLANGLLQMAINTLLIVLGAFVFPFFYLRYMFTRKRWSLQSFMLLPLLFVVPYLVLQLPLETSRDQPAYEAARQFGWQLWMGKLLVASMAVPTVVFTAVWIKHLWFGNWTRLIQMSVIAIVISMVMGGLMLFGRSFQFPAGSRYDWYDWGTVMLILYGSWFVGFFIIGRWIFGSAGRFCIKLAKRIFSRPRLATT